MNIIRQIITTNFTGRSGHPITRETWHTAVSGARTLYPYFNNPASQASSTFYVNNLGEVYQYVEFDKAPYSNSNLDSNTRSITIETWDNGNPNDPIRTPELYRSCAELAVYLYQNFGIPITLVAKSDATNWNVKGMDKHNYFTTTKTCPAGLDIQRIINEANLILNNTPMTNAQIAHDGMNLLGHPLSQEQLDYEIAAWNGMGQNYGSWYQGFRANPECQAFDVSALNKMYADSQKSNEELKALVASQEETIKRQGETISELGVELTNEKQKNEELQKQLTECEAGQSGGTVINIFGLKIIFIRKK